MQTNIETLPNPLPKTLAELKKQLEATGLKCQTVKDFIVCKFTPAKKTIGHTVHGLNVRFACRLVECNVTSEGFYLAFQP